MTFIPNRDIDGDQYIRTKATKMGYHYEPRAIDFTTSSYGSLYNKKHDGNLIADGSDYNDASLCFFDDAGVELTFQQTGYEAETEEQFQTRLNSNCVKTCMNWQPTYDMDMIGGILFVKHNLGSNRAYLWTIVAPDIPEYLGGQVPHVAGGWPLHLFDNADKIIINGRGSKHVVYDPVYNSNKFANIIKHEAGEKIDIAIIYENFKA